MRQFHSIQYLRAIAAFMVLVFHLGLFGGGWKFEAGRAGVDIFFIISGFVMYLSGRDLPAGLFLMRRVVRIVPLYWTMTVLAILLSSNGSDATVADILRSLFFVAYENPGAQPPVSPELSVGWTLNLEMMFYLLFAAGLVLAPRHIVAFVPMVLLVLVAAGRFLPADYAVLRFYASGITLEFAAGLLLGWIVTSNRFTMPPVLCLALLVLGATAILSEGMPDGPRVIRFGLPALAIVAGAVGLEPLVTRRPWGLLGLLGDASYALYLSHILLLGPVLALVEPLALGDPWLQALAVLVICQVLALAIHLFYERPVHRMLHARGMRKRPPTALESSAS